ncbi:unnamed protein product [Clonostachys byssicola]|uniref:DUF7703 domain-containing protein n=1 Tax=Clonostachys byssicola TaxID=160290 RepID=A0A9N9UG21_9HYPO|nr:unnamed protein product [Clonostachys byssicola]
MDDIRDDLPMSMTMAAFAGVAWYIGLEINISLFMMFKRRKGLYFWSCALVSWGIILQTLFIILADFGLWKNFLGAVTMIYLSWFIMVVPQSWVLYSRLHLIVLNQRLLRYIRWALIFNSIVFSVPTIVVGIIAQATDINPALADRNIIWDRVQLTVFFVQETALSLLYIYETRKSIDFSSFFAARPSLSSDRHASTLTTPAERAKNRVLWHLVLANLLIIALDIALLGIQYGGDHLFYLQGAFKPCVYGVKLKVEFLVLNRLIESLWAARGTQHARYNSHPNSGGGGSGHARGGSISVTASKVVASSKSRGGVRSPNLITPEIVEDEPQMQSEAIDLENMHGRDSHKLSAMQSFEGQSSVSERPVTENDGRLFGAPTEPWDATKRR